MIMGFFDIVLALILVAFAVSGYRNGLIKKLIGMVCLVLALIVGTKFSADVADMVLVPVGITGRSGFIIAFLLIVLAITFTQSVIYSVFIKNAVDAAWNKVLGALLAVVEGALVTSIALILMSIYLNLPSDETKGASQLYKPIKNFAPLVFDQVNTFLPESEDFFQSMMKFAQDGLKELEQ